MPVNRHVKHPNMSPNVPAEIQLVSGSTIFAQSVTEDEKTHHKKTMLYPIMIRL